MNCSHTIHHARSHFGWNNAFEPALVIRSGESIEIETLDASGGQLDAQARTTDLERLDFEKVNPVTGPIYVEKAEPGDAVAVEFLEYQSANWGWTANIPGFGLLADEFTEARLHVWNVDRHARKPALFGPGGKVPLKPFCGTVGLAPAENGSHSVIPPRRVGGNMDIRDLSRGVTLYLPVEVAGALLSLGDSHAAQGDGEVCGTAIECQMKVAIRVKLCKGLNLAFPRFETRGPVSRHLDESGYVAATGIGPDLMEAARDAVRGIIDWLCRNEGMDALDAYMLCSVCGDLRISEIVDLPNWTVSFYFPKSVLC